MESQIDKELRSLREEYIMALFNFKNKFAKMTDVNKSADDKKEAFQKLIAIIKEYIQKMVRLEKNKYMRERVFYQNEK
jgi:hypothetical protein